MSTGPAVECVPWGLPEGLPQSPLCSVCTSLSSPLAMDTEPAALTEPSTGQPIDAALGQLPLGLAMPAALVGRGPEGFLGLVEQQYASLRVGTEGVVSVQATATALWGGKEILVTQMWMNAVQERPFVPSAVSILWAVTGASVGRGKAHLQMGCSACLRRGPPSWPQAPQQEWTAW